jgi:hypothetical protein
MKVFVYELSKSKPGELQAAAGSQLGFCRVWAKKKTTLSDGLEPMNL